MFVILVALYFVTSAGNVRLDLTEEKAYTLSNGTKTILEKLDSRVKVRFYCTQGRQRKALPCSDLCQASRGPAPANTNRPPTANSSSKNSIRSRIPTPKTPPGWMASKAGNWQYGDRLDLSGLCGQLGWTKSKPFPCWPPDRERLLEYDLSRAISRVYRPRPVVGIMSAMPVFGDAPDPLMRPGNDRKEEWAFVTELKKDFTIQEVPMATTKIDDSIQVLLVVHPCNISDQAQYALDQFDRAAAN